MKVVVVEGKERAELVKEVQLCKYRKSTEAGKK